MHSDNLVFSGELTGRGWLGWLDSNQRYMLPKSIALPAWLHPNNPSAEQTNLSFTLPVSAAFMSLNSKRQCRKQTDCTGNFTARFNRDFPSVQQTDSGSSECRMTALNGCVLMPAPLSLKTTTCHISKNGKSETNWITYLPFFVKARPCV